MSNQVFLTPLTDNEGDLCYLLEIERLKILLDCGASANVMTRIGAIARDISAVLLSSGDLRSIGGYPTLFARAGLTCPCFITHPATRMGHLALYDRHSADLNVSENDPDNQIYEHSPSLDEIDAAISHLTRLKYSQRIFLRASGGRLSIAPHPSGYVIGACVWLLEVDGGEGRIVYAPELNHQNDRHLTALTLEPLLKPTLLVVGCRGMPRAFVKKKLKEDALRGKKPDLFIFSLYIIL